MRIKFVIFFNHAYVPITMPVENNIWGTKLGTGNFVKTLNKIIRGKRFCSEIYDISTIEKKGKIETEKVYSGEKVMTHPVDDWKLLDSSHPFLTCGDSSKLEWIPDNSIDIVLTDPPFGANVMYSELIDFSMCGIIKVRYQIHWDLHSHFLRKKRK